VYFLPSAKILTPNLSKRKLNLFIDAVVRNGK